MNKEHTEIAWELDDEEYRLALLNTLEPWDTLSGTSLFIYIVSYIYLVFVNKMTTKLVLHLAGLLPS